MPEWQYADHEMFIIGNKLSIRCFRTGLHVNNPGHVREFRPNIKSNIVSFSHKTDQKICTPPELKEKKTESLVMIE